MCAELQGKKVTNLKINLCLTHSPNHRHPLTLKALQKNNLRKVFLKKIYFKYHFVSNLIFFWFLKSISKWMSNKWRILTSIETIYFQIINSYSIKCLFLKIFGIYLVLKRGRGRGLTIDYKIRIINMAIEYIGYFCWKIFGIFQNQCIVMSAWMN